MKCGKLNIGILPEPYIQKWQEYTDLLTDISGAQISLIMRITGDEPEVLVISDTKGISPDNKFTIQPGSFLEKLLKAEEPLSAAYVHTGNTAEFIPELRSCLGIPLIMPDNELFGIICILDRGEINFDSRIQKIILRLSRIIEADLKIYIHDSLINDDLKSREFRFEARFRQIAENIKEVFWIVSADWNEIIYISPAYEEIWGKSCRSLYEDPRSWLDSVAPGDRESLRLSIIRRVSGEVSDPGFPEYRIVRPDGSIRWIYARAFPVKNPEGEIYRMAGIAEDITSRKNIEIELKLKENALDSSLSGIAIINMSGDIVYVNHSCLKMWGYNSADDLKGKKVREFWENPDKAMHVRGEVLGNEIHSGLLSAVRRNGSVFTARISVSMLKGKDGRPLYFLASALDVTEELKAEQVLMESEARLKEAQEIANLGYWDYDIKNNRLTWSDEMYRIFGLEPQSIAPTYDAFIENVHIDERDFVHQIYTGFVYSKIPYDIIHRFLINDGTVKYVNERCRIESDNAGKAIRSFGTVLDITERIKSENQLREILKEKEVLLHEIYHRTRNNMQIICGLLELKSSYLNNSELTEQCMEIESRIMSMALAHEKLSLSKNISKIDLKEYIEDLTSLLMERYKVSGGRITVLIDVENIDLLIDYAIPCGLILSELLTNSFRHAFPGGACGNVTVRGSRCGDDLDIQVRDDGKGFPEDFDFNNAESFGLMIMKSIVIDQLKGRVECFNDSGVSWRILFSDNKYFERV